MVIIMPKNSNNDSSFINLKITDKYECVYTLESRKRISGNTEVDTNG